MVDIKHAHKIIKKYDNQKVTLPASDLIILLGVTGAYLRTTSGDTEQRKMAAEVLQRATKLLYPLDAPNA